MVWIARLRLLVLVMFVMGCAGGGCSDCAGGALTPIQGGYPLVPDTRVARAVQVRVSDQGLQHVAALGPDLLRNAVGDHINVPSQCGDFGVGRYAVCRSGTCGLTLNFPPEPLQLRFVGPDRIEVTIRIGIRGTLPVDTCTLTCNACCNGGTVCPAPLPTSLEINSNCGASRSPYIGLRTNIALRRDTHAPRLSYLRADVVAPAGATTEIVEVPGEGIDGCIFQGCTGALCGLLPIIRDTVLVPAFRGAIGSALDPIRAALQATAMPDPPGCPTGTRVDGMRCRYMDNTIVPSLLGTELHGNFGALLAGFSPGVRSNGALVIAAGDPMRDAVVTPTGMSLNVFGGVHTTQHDACVPVRTEPALPDIPQFAMLQQNMIPGTTRTADLGLGVAETFINHLLFQWWDGGMFCLGVGSSLAPDRLNGSTFAVLVPSLRDVLFPATNGPVALLLRPQQPPRVTLGTAAGDPTLRLAMPELDIDLYAWSEERFVRALTIHTNVTAPVTIMQDAAGLHPSIGMVATERTTVTVSSLSPPSATLGSTLGAVIGTAVMGLGGSLPAIALPSIPVPGTMGMPVGTIAVSVPEGGLRPIEESGARYLGLFADLAYRRAASPIVASTDTVATLVHADPAAVGAQVRLRLDVGATPVEGPYEYAWRVDGLTWSMWTTDTEVDVTSPTFAFAGEHVVEVQSRRAGAAETSDPSPARVAFTTERVDAVRSTGTVRPSDEGVSLIRGGPSTDGGGGCGCAAPGRAAGVGGLWALAVATVMRRRRKALG